METKKSSRKSTLVRMIAWHAALSPGGRLALAFIFNSLLWLVAEQAMEAITRIERSITYHVFSALWMGVTWTVLFNYTLVKSVLSRRKKPTGF